MTIKYRLKHVEEAVRQRRGGEVAIFFEGAEGELDLQGRARFEEENLGKELVFIRWGRPTEPSIPASSSSTTTTGASLP